ncbi:hypothetical protein LX36DRAFT_664996 [Colletotrichum falcatum]|nr:hypothetical protein LX36DRAFT_664996 [Colletotrichum falcatum]
MQNRKGTIVGLIAAFLFLAWFCVGLRVYTRVCIVRTPGWDDFVIVIALLTGSVSAIGLSLTTNYGMGHRMREVPDRDREKFFLLFYFSNASFSMSNALTKLSILFQYLRLFQDRMPRLRIITVGLIVIVLAWGIGFSFMAWFPCFPPYQFYTLGSESNCHGYGSTNPMEIYDIVVASNITNMALDFLILLLPIPLLFSKETIRRTKNGLLGLFCIGILINVIAAWRIVANKATSEKGADPMWIFPPIILLGETENRLSLALASIPVFWPIVTRTWEKIVIVVTHEVKIESAQWAPDVRQTRGASLENHHPPIDRAANEDKANEAGLMHPGRLCDVDGYQRGLISPFAESSDMKQTAPTECERNMAEVERGSVDFITTAV